MYCLQPTNAGLNAPSFLVDVEGTPRRSNGRLVHGIGYCADAFLAAHLLAAFGALTRDQRMGKAAQGIALHGLYGGYCDDPDAPMRLYRDSESGELFNTLECSNDYLDVGHLARAGRYALAARRLLAKDEEKRQLEAMALRLGSWLTAISLAPNGWIPRRATLDNQPYRYARVPPHIAAESGDVYPRPPDSIWDRSGSGIEVLRFLIRLQEVSALDYREFIDGAASAFISQADCFGSVNTDTQDEEESVAFALAFQGLLEVSRLLNNQEARDFAYSVCLPGLDKFLIFEDLNGCYTKGLVKLSDSYSSVCFWESAECAQAFLRAYCDVNDYRFLRNGLTILRAIARNHYGRKAFIPAELDWEGRRPPEQHLDGAPIGPRDVTHPMLNNLNALAPTVYFLERIAWRDPLSDKAVFYDLEGNTLKSDRQES